MITIGITAWNEEKSIERAVNSALNQNFPEDFEIIVDCGGTDNTVSVVKNIAKKNKKVKIIIDKERKGKPNALNKILKKAKGDKIILTDGDVYMGDKAVYFLVKHLRNFDAVSGRPVPTNDRKTELGFWAHLSYEMMNRERMKQAKNNSLFHVSGYLFAFKKHVIDSVPLNALADDAVIGATILSKGYKIGYSPESRIYVKFPTTKSDFLKQKRRTRAGFYQLKEMFNLKTRSMKNEFTAHFKESVFYPDNLKERFYLIDFYFYTAYSWFLANYDFKIKKKKFSEIWKEVKSTK